MPIKKIVHTCVLALSVLLINNVSVADEVTQPDSSITSAVKSKISSDKLLNGSSIEVSTQDGVVNLSGKVESDTQADRATELAQSTPGVTDVSTSDLTIKGSRHPLDDAIITSKIKGMFIQQKLFGDKDVAAMSINVETTNGNVALSGSADDQNQIDNAIKIAESVKGVKQVKSTVKITQ